MRSKFKWIFTLLLALSIQFSFAQERTVTGVVSDASGTLPGANVVVKGTTRGTQTDVDGRYAITAKTGDVLIYSFVGMTDSNVTVGASNNINVTLQSGVTLEAVVIDGYKTTSKKKSSISQTTISAEIFEGRPNVSFLQSLQSQVAGLNIATSSGTPGSAKIDVILRGVGSVNGSIEPLYVIDGVPANQVVFRALNNEDIESITVLKDAGATAIYGNRGSNGVIVIQTKKGKYNSKLQVRVTSTTGFTTLQQNEYNLMNSFEALTLEKSRNVGYGSGLTDEQILETPTTNWRDVFFRTGITRNQNVSFTQGGENMSNFTSLSYFDQDGIVPTTDFKRFTLRSNFNGKSSNDKFTYSTNVTMAYSQRYQLEQETRAGINANVVQNPLQGLLSSMPYVDPSAYVNGQAVFDETRPVFRNPLALVDYIQEGVVPNRYNETKILANASGTYKLTDNLSYTATAAVDYAESLRFFARSPQSFLAIAVRNGVEGTQPDFGGIEQMTTDRDFGFNLLNRLNYNKVFDEKHTLDVSVFSEYIKAHRRVSSFLQQGLDPRTWSFAAGTGYVNYTVGDPLGFYVPTVSGFKADAGLFSYFASADYDYNSKYGVVATIRRDASYKFVEDNTWGTFWSVSARWNIDQESFMSNSSFEILKLRASFGTTGNQNILAGAYGSNPLYLGSNLVRDLNNTGTGYNGDQSAVFPNVIANTALQWETTTQLNVGVDFTYKKRLSGTVDVYQKITTDLFDTNFLSASNGTYQLATNTTGELVNTGVELQLNYDIFKKGDFKMDIFVNGSFNENERRKIVYPGSADLVFQGNIAQQNGRPLNALYLVPYLGVNPENGNLLFQGADGLPTENITDEDRRFVDENFIPTYQGGFGLNASYKGFFLNSNFSFVADIARFDFDLANMSTPTVIGAYPLVRDALDAWTVDNPTGSFPSLDATNESFDGISDRYLRDASYIRLKNLVVGYDVPAKFLDRTFLSSVRVYTQMENYFTWTNWRGFDAESLNASNQGGYPSPKVISFGLDVQF